MKNLLYTLMVFLLAANTYGQNNERFKVSETAKLIVTWNSETPNDSWGKLNSGDKISISLRQAEISVSVVNNNVVKKLVTTSEESDFENTIIKVYEYDFNSDGQNEIIVINSPVFSIVSVKVFRYSNGLAEMIGNFKGQFDIIIDKNIVYLPYGSQGLGEEYLYKNGAFFELIYHNPIDTEDD